MDNDSAAVAHQRRSLEHVGACTTSLPVADPTLSLTTGSLNANEVVRTLRQVQYCLDGWGRGPEQQSFVEQALLQSTPDQQQQMLLQHLRNQQLQQQLSTATNQQQQQSLSSTLAISAASTQLPFQFKATGILPAQQQQQQQQLTDSAAAAAAGSSDTPAKRRRGRPMSSSSHVHPNLVYVRRFRERRKQQEAGLEAELAARRLQVAQLKEEQARLNLKWEALEAVLAVQNSVMQLMQQLSLAQEGSGQQQQQDQQKCSMAAAASQAGGVDATNAAASEKAITGTPVSAWASAADSGQEQQQQHDLLQQACHWLQPVRLYVLRAALMLEELGMLPDNTAAEAALAAAKACPEMAPARAATAAAVDDTNAAANHEAAAAVVAAAVSQAAAAAVPTHAAATAAATVAAAVRSAWDGSTAAAGRASGVSSATAVGVDQGEADMCDNDEVQDGKAANDGVPLVHYPYSIGMYVITPEPVKDVVWALNMSTWAVDENNTQQHAERAARSMWTVLSPERWRRLRATWLTMDGQLQQVQREFEQLHTLLQKMAPKLRSNDSSSGNSGSQAGMGRSNHSSPSDQQQQVRSVDSAGSSECMSGSTSSSSMPDPSSQSTASLAAADAAVSTGTGNQQQQDQQAVSGDGFASLDDTTAYEYAAAAVQIESVLMREDVISFQLLGAFMDCLDPVEMAVGYVCSWPYHPQAFAMLDVMFKLGEPPPDSGADSAAVQTSPKATCSRSS